MSEREAIDFLLYELPPIATSPSSRSGSIAGDARSVENGTVHEESPLLSTFHQGRPTSYFGTDSVLTNATPAPRSDEFASRFENLSALEIAAVSESKKFISQRPVQRIINGVWRGDIIFWETLNVNSVKCPKLYNARRADPFLRLRVPRYLKIFETLFFASFLALYYAVLVRRNFHHVTAWEILLYVWIAGFAYEELGDWNDAGQASFYASDFWWTWDIVSGLQHAIKIPADSYR